MSSSPLSTYNTAASSIKRVSSAGPLSSRTEVKIEPTDVASKAAKKKKKKKVKKESSVVAPVVAESLDGHVIAESAPTTSLRVQLPKQKRPLELQLVADTPVSVSEVNCYMYMFGNETASQLSVMHVLALYIVYLLVIGCAPVPSMQDTTMDAESVSTMLKVC